MKNLIFWTGRSMAILFALFTFLFALDSLGDDRSISTRVLEFTVHLIPSFMIISIIVFSWNRPLSGGLMFLALAAVNIYWSFGKFPIVNYFYISGPLALISLLFLIEWRMEEKQRVLVSGAYRDSGV